MKINFWQILGILLVLAGIAGVVYEKFFAATPVEQKTPDRPSTRPATAPLPLAMTSHAAR